MASNGRTQPTFASSLGTQAHPVATVTLSAPLTPGPAFTAGTTITRTVPCLLAMNGVSHPATATVPGRRDGPELELAGSIPASFAEWGIKTPAGFGFLGSLAGADYVVNARRTDPVRAIADLGGADVAVSVATSPRAFEQAFSSLRRGGRLVCVALPAAGRTKVVARQRHLDDVNLCIEEVLTGQVPARLVFTF